MSTYAALSENAKESQRRWHRAHQRALARLAKQYPLMYRHMLDEELRAEGVKRLERRR